MLMLVYFSSKRLDDLFHLLLKERDEQIVFTFEVKIDRTISDPCLTGDIAHASVVEASLGKRLDRCIEDRSTACSSLGALFR